MKQLLARRFLVAALAVFTAVPMFAQRGPGGSFGARSVEFLAGYLGLTDAQKTQAQAIFTAANTASETARGQMESAQTALRTAIKANAADAELDRLSATIGTINAQMTAIRAKAQAKFYALLTAEQKAKYDQLGDRSGTDGRTRPSQP